MTEQEYLVSTSPSDMHALLVERGLLQWNNSRRFVEACHRVCDCEDRREMPMPTGDWFGLARAWVNLGRPDCKCTKAVRADLIRCIWGNPFRKFTLCGGTVADWPHSQLACQVNPPHWLGCTLCEGFYSWRDGTIPKLARACVEGEECRGGQLRCYGGRVVENEDGVVCKVCKGTGRIASPTIDPLRLAVLADALEEAGCCDEGILGHLRQTEVGDGGACGGQGLEFITRPVTHVRGCWAVELFFGEDEK